MEELYKCYLNCFNILSYRNFNTENYKNMSLEDFKNRYDFFYSNNNILDIYFENDNNICVIHFTDKTNIEKLYNEIKEYYELNNKTYEIIIISIKEIDNDNIIELCEKLENLTIFYYKYIIVDIMKHKYVPKHIIINEKEKLKLKKDMNIKSLELLPYISKYDPVSKFIGIKKGDICKIIRKNKNVGESIYYRFCN